MSNESNAHGLDDLPPEVQDLMRTLDSALGAHTVQHEVDEKEAKESLAVAAVGGAAEREPEVVPPAKNPFAAAADLFTDIDDADGWGVLESEVDGAGFLGGVGAGPSPFASGEVQSPFASDEVESPFAAAESSMGTDADEEVAADAADAEEEAPADDAASFFNGPAFDGSVPELTVSDDEDRHRAQTLVPGVNSPAIGDESEVMSSQEAPAVTEDDDLVLQLSEEPTEDAPEVALVMDAAEEPVFTVAEEAPAEATSDASPLELDVDEVEEADEPEEAPAPSFGAFPAPPTETVARSRTVAGMPAIQVDASQEARALSEPTPAAGSLAVGTGTMISPQGAADVGTSTLITGAPAETDDVDVAPPIPEATAEPDDEVGVGTLIAHGPLDDASEPPRGVEPFPAHGESLETAETAAGVDTSAPELDLATDATIDESKVKSVPPEDVFDPALTGTLGRSRASSVLPISAGGQIAAPTPGMPRYALEKELGRGAMGEVVLARDSDIGRDVALKRLTKELEGTDVTARFVDEIRLMGRMEHPNIAPIYDVGVDADGRLFFVMRYVEGETLADIIDRLQKGDAETHKEFPFMRRMDIFMGIMRALEFAHGRGVLHRDIKPENIMIGPHGEVVVMDWGIARAVDGAEEVASAESEDQGPERLAETTAGALVGTPLYMSPEQATMSSADLDGRTDLYSAFVVLFELLTLTRLVGDATTLADVAIKVTREAPPGLTAGVWVQKHQPAVPVELRHFVIHGLAKKREQRFQSAVEVVDEIELIYSGHVRVQCPVTFAKRLQADVFNMFERVPMIGVMAVLLAPVVLLALVAAVVLLAMGIVEPPFAP